MGNGGVKIIEFSVGECVGPAKIALRNMSWKRVRFISRVFLVETERHGNILFDAGYAEEYFDHIEPLYNRVLPVSFSKENSLSKQLSSYGISHKDISYVFVSHYHPDHIAGLKGLGKIPWIYRDDVLRQLRGCGRFKAFKHGFFKGMVPEVPKGSIPVYSGSFDERLLNSHLKSFRLFGDDKVRVVDLPGHAMGQMGLCVGNTLLLADAMWSEESLQTKVLPSWLDLFLQHNRKEYSKTFFEIQWLKERHPDLIFLPTHRLEKL